MRTQPPQTHPAPRGWSDSFFHYYSGTYLRTSLCHPQSCEVHLERQVAKIRADPGEWASSPPGGSCPNKLQAEAQWPYLSEGFLANASEML